MYWDKRAAVQQSWRVPERTLLFWAFLGGGIGAKLAQLRSRHKTRTNPFRALLNAALLINALTAIILAVPVLRDGAFYMLKYALILFR